MQYVPLCSAFLLSGVLLNFAHGTFGGWTAELPERFSEGLFSEPVLKRLGLHILQLTMFVFV